jgi:hypothetical protein
MNQRSYVPALLLALCLAPSIARAQGSDFDRNTARTLWQEGREALSKRDYTTAADRFTRSDSLFHAPTSLLGLAQAQVGLGKLVSAAETYNRLLRDPLPPGAPPAFIKALDAARAELAALSPRIPYVTIRVMGPGAAVAQVSVDGIAVPSAALGVRRAIDPGQHRIQAEAPGHAPAVATLTIAEGKTETVTVEPKPLAAGAPAPKPLASDHQPAEPSPAGQEGGARRTAGLVVGGIGAAGLAVGGILGIVTLVKSNGANASSACTGPATLANVDSCNSQRDAARGLQTGGIAVAVAGGVALGVGAVLFATAPRSADRPATLGGAPQSPSVALIVNAGGAWVSGRF